MQQLEQIFLPATAVAARYGVSGMSLWRWLQNEVLGFPEPRRISRRRYWKLSELQAWEASRPSEQTEEVLALARRRAAARLEAEAAETTGGT